MDKLEFSCKWDHQEFTSLYFSNRHTYVKLFLVSLVYYRYKGIVNVSYFPHLFAVTLFFKYILMPGVANRWTIFRCYINRLLLKKLLLSKWPSPRVKYMRLCTCRWIYHWERWSCLLTTFLQACFFGFVLSLFCATIRGGT